MIPFGWLLWKPAPPGFEKLYGPGEWIYLTEEEYRGGQPWGDKTLKQVFVEQK